MADLDTRQKRTSGISIGLPWRWMLPVADGAIGQADRQQTAYLYSGILADSPAVVVTASGNAQAVDLYCWSVPRDQYAWTVQDDSYRWSVKRDRVEI